MNDEFRQFFREHASYVAESLRRLGVRSGDAEDMTHEVFLSVHKKWGEFDRARPAKPWLFAFAFRVASNYRAHSSIQRELLATGDSAPDKADSSPDVLARLEQAAAKQQVYDALLALPMDRRSVFVMHELDGRPMQEIASELEVPLQTAYSRLRIAREEFSASVRRLAQREAHGSLGARPARSEAIG